MQTIAQQLGIKKFPFRINDDKGNVIYYETSDGFWHKQEFDEKGNRIYHENSDGVIEDNRPKCENKVVAQQTAVDWLFIQLYEKFEMKGDGMEMDKVLEQANQMFEEQIEKAWWAGHDERDSNHMIYPSEDCNQYYNQTFGETNNL